MTRILIDTGPDLRQQMINTNVDWVDAVLYTHPHADHIHGIDDLRAFAINRQRRVQTYMDADTSERIRTAFDYCFRTPRNSNYKPILAENRISAFEPIVVDGPGGVITAMPFRQIHGDIHSLGFRFGDLAYSSDLNGIPDESLPYLADLDIWIVASLRDAPHVSHFSVDEAVSWAQRLHVGRTILTHMHSDLDYGTLRNKLPAGIEPAYDGMKMTVTAAP